MRGFKPPKQAQRFFSAHAHIGTFFEFAIVTRLMPTIALPVVKCQSPGKLRKMGDRLEITLGQVIFSVDWLVTLSTEPAISALAKQQTRH